MEGNKDKVASLENVAKSFDCEMEYDISPKGMQKCPWARSLKQRCFVLFFVSGESLTTCATLMASRY